MSLAMLAVLATAAAVAALTAGSTTATARLASLRAERSTQAAGPLPCAGDGEGGLAARQPARSAALGAGGRPTGHGPQHRGHPRCARLLGIGCCTAGCALVAGLAAAAAVALVLVMTTKRRANARRRKAALAALADATALSLSLAAELRAGRSGAQAFAVVAEVAAAGVGDRLRRAAAAARLGGDVGDVLTRPPIEPELADALLSPLAACWQVSNATGAGLAAAVDRLAESAQQSEQHRREVEAETSGARTSALLLAGLPIVGFGLGTAMGVAPLRMLLHTPLGSVCLVFGLALDAAGLAWTDRLCARALGSVR